MTHIIALRFSLSYVRLTSSAALRNCFLLRAGIRHFIDCNLLIPRPRPPSQIDRSDILCTDPVRRQICKELLRRFRTRRSKGAAFLFSARSRGSRRRSSHSPIHILSSFYLLRVTPTLRRSFHPEIAQIFRLVIDYEIRYVPTVNRLTFCIVE